MAASVQRFDSELIAHLRSRRHRVTSQRLILHRVLRELDRHVTAEELLEATGDRLPNVSLPTVYATLELFDDLGLVRRFSLGGGALLWDPRTQEHHHLSCRLCGRVEDLEASLDAGALMAAAASGGFAPDRAEVAVIGVCRSCAGSGQGLSRDPAGRRDAPDPHVHS